MVENKDMEELKEIYIEIKLGDIAYFQKGFAFKSKDFENVGRKIVKVSNLTDQSIDINSCVCLAEKLAEKYERYSLNLDDIIITTVGSWPTNPASVVGKVIKVPKKAETALLNQNAVRIRANEKITQKYLYYVLKYEKFKNYIINTAQGSASQASITQEDIKNYLIKLPSLETQEKIASILSTLDDKIEINNEMNKTLEEMAQTLFKRWFIDFDFPNENGEPYRSSGGKMVDSELGEIPEGWEVATLESKKEFGELIMGLSPKSESYNELQQGLPLLNGAADFTKLKLSPKKYTTSPTRIAKKGDYVFCIRATIGLLSTTDKDYVIGRGVATIKDIKVEYREYIYMVLNNSFEKLKQNATGSVIQGLSKPDINNIKILFPIYLTMKNFNGYMSKIFEKIENNRKEIQSLTEIRDTLLPKLMSGEVEV